MGFTSYPDLQQKKDQGRFFTRRVGSSVGIGAAGWYARWGATAGDPASGSYAGTALNANQANDATAGAILHGGNVSAETKHLLRMMMNVQTNSSAAPAVVMIYDRLLYYPQVSASINTNQALVNGVALPRYTDGIGVRAWLEVTTTLGTGTGVLTYGTSGYTNSAGTTGRQHAVTVNSTASVGVPKIPHSGGNTINNAWNPFMPLQAGDLGVRSIESIQFTTAHSAGVCALVLGYPLAMMSLPQFETACERDFLFRGAALPRIYDGACLDILIYVNATISATVVYGADFDFVWG